MKDFRTNKVGAARFFGVTVQALDRWFSSGCPVAEHDDGGAIKAVDLSAMAKWRIDRSSKDKGKSSREELSLESAKKLACNFVVPALVRDFLICIKPIAEEVGIDEEQAKEVWGFFTQMSYETLERFFGEPIDGIEMSDPVIAAAKEVGARRRTKVGKSHADSQPQ